MELARKYGPRSRRRVLSQPEILHATHKSYDRNGNFVRMLDEYDMVVCGDVSTIDDVVTKSYHKRVANGEIINSPRYSKSIFHVAVQGSKEERHYHEPYAGFSGSVTYSGICTYFRYSYAWPSPRSFAEGLAYHRQQAINRAYAKAQSATFSAIVDLYELPETIQMLRTLVRRLKAGYGFVTDLPALLRQFRQLRRSGHTRRSRPQLRNVLGLGRRYGGELNGLYLEWRFGWGPLIKSIFDLVEALQNSLRTNRPLRITYRATENFHYKAEDPVHDEVNPIGAPRGIPVTHGTNTEIVGKFKAGILLVNPKLSMRKEFGLRASDLPSALWDLVPYTFVLDRLIDVSTWLKAITFDGRANILATWVTEQSVRTHVYKVEPANGTIVSGSGASQKRYTMSRTTNSYTERFEVVNREVGVQPSTLPLLDVDLSTFQNNQHIVDYVALILAQLRSIHGRR